MAANHQDVEGRLGRNESLDYSYIVHDAGSRGVANHSFDVLRANSVDDTLDGAPCGGRIQQINGMSILQGYTGGGGQPFWVLKRSTLGNRWATLLAGKSRVKRRIQEQNAHMFRLEQSPFGCQ